MKKIMFLIAFMLIFSMPVYAEQTDEIYSEQYKTSGAESLPSALPDDVRDFLSENGIDPSSYSFIDTITVQNVFSHIKELLAGGMATPLKSGGAMLGIILLCSAFSSFCKENASFDAAIYAAILCICAVAVSPILKTVSATVSALKGSSVFMLSFIPVFAAIIAASGAAATSAAMSGVLLIVSQAVSYISSFVITPLMSGYLALSITSSVSPLLNQSGICEGIKKLSYWILSLISTVFLGVLGIQTSISSSADTLSMRMAKFVLGSAVPIAGSAVTEAFSTVTASMGVLRSTIGIYGVIALVVIFLPIIIELILWRFIMLINGAAADIFSLPKISGILRAVDTMLSLLIGIILTVSVVFIISLTLVTTAGKVQ